MLVLRLYLCGCLQLFNIHTSDTDKSQIHNGTRSVPTSDWIGPGVWCTSRYRCCDTKIEAAACIMMVPLLSQVSCSGRCKPFMAIRPAQTRVSG